MDPKTGKEYKNRHLIDSFYDAIRGVWICIKTERNMRIHTVMAAYVLFFAPFLGISRAEYAILIVVIGIVVSSEAFNTAIENLCNYTCKNKNRFIGITKDISAGAVFASAFFALCVGVVILWRPAELWALLLAIFTSPICAVVFVLVSVISVIYIIKGPLGIVRMLRGKKD